jgi:hypothetical protein
MRHRVREWACVNSGVNGSVTIAAASAKLPGSPQWPDSQAHDDEIAVLGPVTSSALLALNSSQSARITKMSAIPKMLKIQQKKSQAKAPGGRAAPAEGPPPSLPRTPPFVFIPRVTPTGSNLGLGLITHWRCSRPARSGIGSDTATERRGYNRSIARFQSASRMISNTRVLSIAPRSFSIRRPVAFATGSSSELSADGA